jgi:hypothetical protein
MQLQRLSLLWKPLVLLGNVRLWNTLYRLHEKMYFAKLVVIIMQPYVDVRRKKQTQKCTFVTDSTIITAKTKKTVTPKVTEL